jgi:sialic acid synthase SpsE
MKFSDFLSTAKTDIGLRRPFILAEIGVNHEGDMDIARHLIDLAKSGGADGVKFQTYTADGIVLKNSPSYWDTSFEKTSSQWELFKKYDKFWKTEYFALAEYCKKKDIEFLSTPFDLECLEFLTPIMPAIKISSSDLNNKPFVRQIAATGKPIILSTGAADEDEIRRTLSWIEPTGNDVVLLHCVLNYPTEDHAANLGMIKGLKRAFSDLIIGYSDHTMPKDMTTLVSATMLGARLIEKHFTHDKTLPGNDHYHAMNANDLITFNRQIDRLIELYGMDEVTHLETENISRVNARRSIVSTRAIKKGEILDDKNLTFKRPGNGIPVDKWDDVIGETVIVDIDANVQIESTMLKK